MTTTQMSCGGENGMNMLSRGIHKFQTKTVYFNVSHQTQMLKFLVNDVLHFWQSIRLYDIGHMLNILTMTMNT